MRWVLQGNVKHPPGETVRDGQYYFLLIIHLRIGISTRSSATAEEPRDAKFKIGHVTLTTPLLRVILVLGLDVVSVCTKFDYSSFSRSRNIFGAFQNLNGSRDLTTPLSGLICNPLASTYYDRPIYLI